MVNIDRCVVAGDQAEIDGGNVVRVDRLSTESVHWLAGHRTSHGAPFRDLTGLQVDDVVVYRGMQYRVVEYRLVDRYEQGDVDTWSSASTPSVVLQTSYNNTYVHVWRAVEVAPLTQWQHSAPEPPTRVETNQNVAASAEPSTAHGEVRVRGSRLVMFS